MKLLLLVGLLAVAIPPRPADACSCSAPYIEISPSRSFDAPINTTVMAWVPVLVAPIAKITLSLRDKVNGDPVPVDYRSTGAADVNVVELVPRAPLKPRTAYEVVVARDGALDDVVGKFTTGTAKLEKAPVWSGPTQSVYVQGRKVCCNCTTDEKYALISLADNPTDDERRAAASSRFAIWLAGADGKIDYTKPPTTYHEGTAYALALGRPSICSANNFVLPKRKAVKVGIKLVDLAGNASSPREIVLDTTKPVARPR